MIGITTYLGVPILYDPKEQIFFATVSDKVLQHKKQTGLEALVKKAKEPKKARGRPRTQPAEESKPKRKYTRRVNKEQPSNNTDTTPADLIKNLDDVDTAAALLDNKLEILRRKTGMPELPMLITFTKQELRSTVNTIKTLINHVYKPKE